MDLRTLLLPAALLAATPLLADEATTARLEAAFAALTTEERVIVQEELEIAGLHAGPVDGSTGPGDGRTLEDAAAFIEENSAGMVVVPLATDEEARSFAKSLAERGYSSWLYGEGDEG
ncbi:hypothetical protein [Rhodobacter sp. NSM]|uniref:hypothetical protein n=1 Tax=Rhodobacter sp. NSM TaxID=3457501 RepID=UPI003FD5BA24